MAEDPESDIAIRFVDENDYGEISAKAVSAKRKLKLRVLAKKMEKSMQAGGKL